MLYLKQVIAIGGDTVEGRDNEIFLHGALSNEKYVKHISSEVLMPFRRSFWIAGLPISDWLMIAVSLVVHYILFVQRTSDLGEI